MSQRPRRKRARSGRGGLLPPLGVAAAQEQLSDVVVCARVIEGALDMFTRALAAPGPPAEGRDETAKRLRSYLLAMVQQIRADEAEPLLAALERVATITAEEIPDEFPSE